MAGTEYRAGGPDETVRQKPQRGGGLGQQRDAEGRGPGTEDRAPLPPSHPRENLMRQFPVPPPGLFSVSAEFSLQRRISVSSLLLNRLTPKYGFSQVTVAHLSVGEAPFAEFIKVQFRPSSFSHPAWCSPVSSPPSPRHSHSCPGPTAFTPPSLRPSPGGPSIAPRLFPSLLPGSLAPPPGTRFFPSAPMQTSTGRATFSRLASKNIFQIFPHIFPQLFCGKPPLWALFKFTPQSQNSRCFTFCSQSKNTTQDLFRGFVSSNCELLFFVGGG